MMPVIFHSCIYTEPMISDAPCRTLTSNNEILGRLDFLGFTPATCQSKHKQTNKKKKKLHFYVQIKALSKSQNDVMKMPSS